MPPLNHYKLKFDGASKGSPEDVRIRRAIHDYKGGILRIYNAYIG